MLLKSPFNQNADGSKNGGPNNIFNINQVELMWNLSEAAKNLAKYIRLNDITSIRNLLESNKLELRPAIVNYSNNPNNRSSLFVAVSYELPMIVELLLQQGATATLNCKDVYGKRPIDLALELNNMELIHLLLSWGAELKLADLLKHLDHVKMPHTKMTTEHALLLMQYLTEKRGLEVDMDGLIALLNGTEIPLDVCKRIIKMFIPYMNALGIKVPHMGSILNRLHAYYRAMGRPIPGEKRDNTRRKSSNTARYGRGSIYDKNNDKNSKNNDKSNDDDMYGESEEDAELRADMEAYNQMIQSLLTVDHISVLIWMLDEMITHKAAVFPQTKVTSGKQLEEDKDRLEKERIEHEIKRKEEEKKMAKRLSETGFVSPRSSLAFKSTLNSPTSESSNATPKKEGEEAEEPISDYILGLTMTGFLLPKAPQLKQPTSGSGISATAVVEEYTLASQANTLALKAAQEATTPAPNLPQQKDEAAQASMKNEEKEKDSLNSVELLKLELYSKNMNNIESAILRRFQMPSPPTAIVTVPNTNPETGSPKNPGTTSTTISISSFQLSELLQFNPRLWSLAIATAQQKEDERQRRLKAKIEADKQKAAAEAAALSPIALRSPLFAARQAAAQQHAAEKNKAAPFKPTRVIALEHWLQCWQDMAWDEGLYSIEVIINEWKRRHDVQLTQKDWLPLLFLWPNRFSQKEAKKAAKKREERLARLAARAEAKRLLQAGIVPPGDDANVKKKSTNNKLKALPVDRIIHLDTPGWLK